MCQTMENLKVPDDDNIIVKLLALLNKLKRFGGVLDMRLMSTRENTNLLTGRLSMRQVSIVQIQEYGRRHLSSQANILYLASKYIPSRPARPHDQYHGVCLP